MELPPAKEKVPRIIDGEMMYLDNSRRQKVEPVPIRYTDRDGSRPI